MAQLDIIKELEKEPDRWFNSLDIAEKLNRNRPAVQIGIKKLIKHNQIKHKILPRTGRGCCYIYIKAK